MSEIREVHIDDIHLPDRDEKLHPYENELDERQEQVSNADGKDLNSWEEFRESVGTQPNKPPTVIENGDGYVLVDGDRRMRALTENDAESVRVLVRDDVEDKTDLFTKRLEANEYRKPNDKKRRSWYIAQLCAPWLLPPGERDDEIDEIMTQTAVGKKLGHQQGVISDWLNPMRDEYPLRSVVADFASGRTVDEDQVATIDEVVDYLKFGDDKVIPIGQDGFVANELGDMEGVSLDELRKVAKEAADGGWNDNRFLKELNDKYAYDPAEDLDDEIEGGMMDGSDLDFEDDTVPESPTDAGDEFFEDEESEETPIPQIESGDINWSDYVDDDDLNQPLSQIETRRMITQSVEDEGAVAVHILCDITGMSQREVMQNVVEPMLADFTASWLQENV